MRSLRLVACVATALSGVITTALGQTAMVAPHQATPISGLSSQRSPTTSPTTDVCENFGKYWGARVGGANGIANELAIRDKGKINAVPDSTSNLVYAACEYWHHNCRTGTPSCEEYVAEVQAAAGRPLSPLEVLQIARCTGCSSSCSSLPPSSGECGDDCDHLFKYVVRRLICADRNPVTGQTEATVIAGAICDFLSSCSKPETSTTGILTPCEIKGKESPPCITQCLSVLGCLRDKLFVGDDVLCELFKSTHSGCFPCASGGTCDLCSQLSSSEVLRYCDMLHPCADSGGASVACRSLTLLLDVQKACRCASELSAPSDADKAALVCAYMDHSTEIDSCYEPDVYGCLDVLGCLMQSGAISNNVICSMAQLSTCFPDSLCEGIIGGGDWTDTHHDNAHTHLPTPSSVACPRNARDMRIILQAIKCLPSRQNGGHDPFHPSNISQDSLNQWFCDWLGCTTSTPMNCNGVRGVLRGALGQSRGSAVSANLRGGGGCGVLSNGPGGGCQPGTDPNNPEDEAGPDTECPDDGYLPSESDHPVSKAYGNKIESGIDVDVSLPGKSYRITRNYNSASTLTTDSSGKKVLNDGGQPNIVGWYWTLSCFRRAQWDEGTDGSGNVVSVVRQGSQTRQRSRHFVYDSTSSSWTGPGATDDRFVQATIFIDGEPWSVLRQIRAGHGYVDFIDGTDAGTEDLEGYIIHEQDEYGNSNVYRYDTLWIDTNNNHLLDQNGTGTPEFYRVRLSEILLGCRASSSSVIDASSPAAIVRFSWNSLQPSDGRPPAQLAQIEVKRLVNNSGDTEWITTDRVQYTYADANNTDAITGNPDLGTPGDLIEVKRSTLLNVNSSSTSTTDYMRATQYRYHSASESTTSVQFQSADQIGGSGAMGSLGGYKHELKAVIGADQIEMLAAACNPSTTPPFVLTDAQTQPRRIEAALQILRAAPDLGTAIVGTTSSVTIAANALDMASKVLGYRAEDGDTATQFLLATCGCGGSAQGERIDYTYTPATYTVSGAGTFDAILIKLDENVADPSSGTWVLHRTRYTDTAFFPMGDGSTAPFAVNEAIVEPGTSGRAWVTHIEYDMLPDFFGGHPYTTEKIYSPSAIASYNPSGTTVEGRVTFASGATGRVDEYEYTNEKLLKRHWVENVNGSNKSLIEQNTYSSTAGHEWALAKTERVRVEGAATLPSSADDIETTEFEYGFFSGSFPDAVQWVRTGVEAELVAENGPGGTYYSAVVFDSAGRPQFVVDAAGTVTKNIYPTVDVHGRPTEVHVNAGPSGVPTITSVTPSTNSDGEFTTTYQYDALGRAVMAEAPSGVRRGTLRWLTVPNDPVWRVSSSVELHDMPVWTVVGSPFQLASSSSLFDNAVSVERTAAGGHVLERCEHQVGNPSTYAPENGTLTLGDELARSSSAYTLNGQRYRVRAWPHVPTSAIRSGGWHNDEFFFYDNAGRVRFRVEPVDTASGSEPQVGSATSPTATVTEYQYDVNNRVTDVYVGTDLIVGSGTNRRKVSGRRYDEQLSGSSWVQVAGDGHLTSVDTYPDASTTRTTRGLYDWRGRVIAVQPAVPPYQLALYDNLDRVVEGGTYTAMPTWSGGALPSTGRVAHNRAFFSQRGLVYRGQPSMTPSSSFTAGIESDAWYDAVGRIVENAPASSPARKVVYDSLGRVTVSAVTDRGGDAAPGQSGNYANAVTFTGDTVYEQTNTRYDSTAGLPDLVTHFVRRHDVGETSSTSSGRLDHTDQIGTAVKTFTAYGHDAAYRVVRTVQFGTNLASDVTANSATVNMGKDVFAIGGSTPTWSTLTTPDYNTSGYGNTLVNAVAYDVRGMVDTTTDALGRKTKTYRDDIGRVIGVAENYTSASITWSTSSNRWTVTWPSGAVPAPDLSVVQRNPDTDAHDRITTTVYDAAGRKVKAVAHVPSQSDANAAQVTQYVYGTTLSNSDIETMGLVRKVVYPDQTTSSADLTVYAYNRLGELKSFTDQNGTVHTYTRDSLGRVTKDAVTTFGSTTDGSVTLAVDNAVQAIVASYDSAGRLEYVNSTSDAAGTTPVNGVAFEYTDLQQVFRVRENMSGAASTSDPGTKSLYYAYFNHSYGVDGDNFSRLAYIQYPNSTQVVYDYSSGGTATPNADSRTCRANGLACFVSANYQFNGLSMPVVIDYYDLDVQLDRTIDRAGDRAPYPATPTQTAGVYPGFDRFGHLKRQVWVYGDTAPQTSGQRMTRKALSEIEYTYDRASSLTARYDVTLQAASSVLPARQYATDNLGRVRETLYGRAALGPSDINNTLPTFTLGTTLSDYWSLDATGNWLSRKTDGGGATSGGLPQYDQASTLDSSHNRTHSTANNLTDDQTLVAGSSSGQPLVPFGYDHRGNMVRKGSQPTPNMLYTYDAWNRLVKVQRNESGSMVTVNEFGYNGLHWCVKIKEASGHREFPALPYTLDTTRGLYYTLAWQPVYETVDYGNDGTIDAERESVYGLTYVDECIGTRVKPTGSSSKPAIYNLYDAQYSVVGRMEDAGVLPRLTERVTYDVYGFPTARKVFAADLTDSTEADYSPDGSVNSHDSNAFDAWYALGDPRADIADDAGNIPPVGTNSGVTADDAAAFYASYDDATSGTIVFLGISALPGHGDGGFCGYAWQPASAIYLVRHRAYDPAMGRWLQRDPAGYINGMSLYQYAMGRPASGVDPSGTDLMGVYNPGADGPIGAGGLGARSRPAPSVPAPAPAPAPRMMTSTSDLDNCTNADGVRLADQPEEIQTLAYIAVQLSDPRDRTTEDFIQVFQNHPWAASNPQSAINALAAHYALNLSGLRTYIAGYGIDIETGRSTAGAGTVRQTAWRNIGGAQIAINVVGAAFGAEGMWGALEGGLTPEFTVGAGSSELDLALASEFSGGAELPAAIQDFGAGPITQNCGCGGNPLNILNPHFTPNGARVLQNLTNRVNAQLSGDLSLAASVLTDDQMAAAAQSIGLARMQYGNALEGLVAAAIRDDPTLSSLFSHVGGASNPDFIGEGIFRGMNFDITTPAQIDSHLARPGYGPGLNVITYERPAGFP